MTTQRTTRARSPARIWLVVAVAAADAALRLWMEVPRLDPGNPFAMLGLMAAVVAGVGPFAVLIAALTGSWQQRSLVRGAVCLVAAEVIQFVRIASVQSTNIDGLFVQQTPFAAGGAAGAIAVTVLQIAGATAIGFALSRAAAAHGLPRRTGWPAVVLVIGLLVALTQVTIVVASRSALESGPADAQLPILAVYDFVPALLGCVVPFAWASLAAAALSVRSGAGWPWVAAAGLITIASRAALVLVPILYVDPVVPRVFDDVVAIAVLVEAVGLVVLVAGIVLGPIDPSEGQLEEAEPAPVRAPEGAA